MFGHSGAATRSVNHRLRGLTFDPPTLPAAAFINYHLFMTSDPSLWGLVLAYEASPGAFLASMVFDHPMLTTPLDTTYPNSFTHPLVPLSAPKLSPFRFAHLRAYHPTITTGATSPFNALPDVTLTRLYTDSAAVTTSTNFVYSDDTYLHRQFPVALNLPGQVEGFDYILTWPTPLPPSPIVLHVDDMDTDLIPAGSLFRIQLQPLGNVIATLQVQRNGSPLAPVPLGQLASQPATAWAVSGSSLHFRVVSATRGEVLTLSW